MAPNTLKQPWQDWYFTERLALATNDNEDIIMSKDSTVYANANVAAPGNAATSLPVVFANGNGNVFANGNGNVFANANGNVFANANANANANSNANCNANCNANANNPMAGLFRVVDLSKEL